MILLSFIVSIHLVSGGSGYSLIWPGGSLFAEYFLDDDDESSNIGYTHVTGRCLGGLS
jgi:hypothetical protein